MMGEKICFLVLCFTLLFAIYLVLEIFRFSYSLICLCYYFLGAWYVPKTRAKERTNIIHSNKYEIWQLDIWLTWMR